MANIQFLQGAPTQNVANIESTLGAIYLKNYVDGNKESNRLFIGTSNGIGGIKPIVTPTPYSLTLRRDNDEMGTFDGSADLVVNFEVVPLVPSTDNAIARFNGAAGYIQNSKVLIDDNGNIIMNATTANTIKIAQNAVSLQYNATTKSLDFIFT